ncbi:MAG: winged helix-turn-helix domain-containing protein [Acidobacteriaceae bacterium]
MPVLPTENVIRFGLFELDLKSGLLRRNGGRVRIPQQPVQVLALLLERPGEVVTRDELRERLWSPDTFVNFDHGLNKSVQKLRNALGDSAESPRFIETIPRVGYRFIAPVKESVRPHIQAADEQTENHFARDPAIGKREPSVPRTKPQTSAAWLLLAGCVAVLLMSVGWLIYNKHERDTQMAPIHSLAVLPLENLSGEHDQDYFAEGMTDELTTMLAKDSTLRIVSRTSAMQYKGAHRPLREIAQALAVDGVVEGSVERSGDKAHVTLQLIRGSSDMHVWAESYDRDANNLASLPNEAAMAIAKRTNSAVPRPAPVRYVNPEAHDAYLRGRYLWTVGRNDEAGKYFKKAVELQPDYALGWVGVSKYYGVGGVGGALNPREAFDGALAAAKKAVELDDGLAEAHLVLSGTNFYYWRDLALAEREYARAIELDPGNAGLYFLRAKMFAVLNRPEDAIEQAKKSMELDSFAMPWIVGYFDLLGRHYDAALEELRQSYARDPGTLYLLAAAYRCKGMYAEAAKSWEDGLIAEGKQADAESIRRAFGRGGYRAVLFWNLAGMKKQASKHYVSPVHMALQYAQLGLREETLSQLEQGYRQHSPGMLYIQDDPAYDFVHSDERYRAIIKGMGLPRAY